MKRSLLMAAPLLLATTLLTGCGEPEHLGVVVIVVDTLRADHLGFYGHARDTTPNLDRRVASGRVFERAWTTAPWTLPSFGTILTGEIPSRHRAGTVIEGDRRNLESLSHDVTTLGQLLSRREIATGAIMSNPFLHPRFGLKRGFAHYDFQGGDRNQIRRAGKAVELALDWIAAHRGERFFLLTHFFDPHFKYAAPPPFRGRFTGAPEGEPRYRWSLKKVRVRQRDGLALDMEFLAAAYDEEVAYVDECIEKLLRGLTTLGVGETTLVLLTADHGEEFLDHDGFEHGHSLFDELLRVPLVLWGPGVRRGRSSRPVSLLDVTPTVLDYFDLAAPSSLPGSSLLGLPHSARAPLVAEHLLYGPERKAVIDWPWKLIRNPGGGPPVAYDLENDPGERRPLESLEAVPGAARVALHGLEEGAAPPAGTAADLDEETLRQLRSLGYVD